MDPVGRLHEDIGEAGITDLVRRFYAKVRADEIIGPLYPPDDWENAEWRLRMFLMQRFGGPTTYSEERGHPRLRMRHAPFAIGRREAGQWLRLMRDSLREASEAGTFSSQAAEAAWPYFVETALFLVNREEKVHEPA